MPPLLQPGDPLDEDYDAKATRAQYELLSNALERFRKRRHSEYLLSLREKHNNVCAEDPTHHLSVGKLVMVRHDNVHRIEWPLGVITAVYSNASGVIRTAEVEECGKWSLRPTYLVPLELDCRHDDDAIRLCQREREGNEEEDADDNEEDDTSVNKDSITDLNPSGSIVSDGTKGRRFLPDVTLEESIPTSVSQNDSTISADVEGQRFLPDVSEHRTLGSSRESGLAIGTNDGCNVSATPNTVPESLTPTTVATQKREGAERDGGDAMNTARPQKERRDSRERSSVV